MSVSKQLAIIEDNASKWATAVPDGTTDYSFYTRNGIKLRRTAPDADGNTRVLTLSHAHGACKAARSWLWIQAVAKLVSGLKPATITTSDGPVFGFHILFLQSSPRDAGSLLKWLNHLTNIPIVAHRYLVPLTAKDQGRRAGSTPGGAIEACAFVQSNDLTAETCGIVLVDQYWDLPLCTSSHASQTPFSPWSLASGLDFKLPIAWIGHVSPSLWGNFGPEMSYIRSNDFVTYQVYSNDVYNHPAADWALSDGGHAPSGMCWFKHRGVDTMVAIMISEGPGLRCHDNFVRDMFLSPDLTWIYKPLFYSLVAFYKSQKPNALLIAGVQRQANQFMTGLVANVPNFDEQVRETVCDDTVTYAIGHLTRRFNKLRDDLNRRIGGQLHLADSSASPETLSISSRLTAQLRHKLIHTTYFGISGEWFADTKYTFIFSLMALLLALGTVPFVLLLFSVLFKGLAQIFALSTSSSLSLYRGLRMILNFVLGSPSPLIFPGGLIRYLTYWKGSPAAPLLMELDWWTAHMTSYYNRSLVWITGLIENPLFYHTAIVVINVKDVLWIVLIDPFLEEMCLKRLFSFGDGLISRTLIGVFWDLQDVYKPLISVYYYDLVPYGPYMEWFGAAENIRRASGDVAFYTFWLSLLFFLFVIKYLIHRVFAQVYHYTGSHFLTFIFHAFWNLYFVTTRNYVDQQVDDLERLALASSFLAAVPSIKEIFGVVGLFAIPACFVLITVWCVQRCCNGMPGRSPSHLVSLFFASPSAPSGFRDLLKDYVNSNTPLWFVSSVSGNIRPKPLNPTLVWRRRESAIYKGKLNDALRFTNRRNRSGYVWLLFLAVPWLRPNDTVATYEAVIYSRPCAEAPGDPVSQWTLFQKFTGWTYSGLMPVWEDLIDPYMDNISSGRKKKRALVALFDYLSFQLYMHSSHKRNDLMIKLDEVLLAKLLGLKARSIINVAPIYQIVIGPFIREITRQLKVQFNGLNPEGQCHYGTHTLSLYVLYACGLSTTLVDDFYNKALTTKGVWLMVSGDDSLTVINTGDGFPVILEEDFRMYDQSERLGAVVFEINEYWKMGLPQAAIEALYVMQTNPIRVYRRRDNLHMGYIRSTVRAPPWQGTWPLTLLALRKLVATHGTDAMSMMTRLSGSPNTTTGNTLVHISIKIMAYTTQDLSKPLSYAKFGVEVTSMLSSNPALGTFLKGWFQARDDGKGYTWCPLPSRVTRICKRNCQFGDTFDTHAELCIQSSGIRGTSLGPLCSAFLSQFPPSRNHTTEPWKLSPGIVHKVDRLSALNSISLRYDLTLAEVLHLESRCQRYHFGFTELWGKVAAVDYL